MGIGFNKDEISFTVKLIEGTTISYGTVEAQTPINKEGYFTLDVGAILTLGKFSFHFGQSDFVDVRQQDGITLTLKPEEKQTFTEIKGLADYTATINTPVTFSSQVKNQQEIVYQWEISKSAQIDGKPGWQRINPETDITQSSNYSLTDIQPFPYGFDELGGYRVRIMYRIPPAKNFSEGKGQTFYVIEKEQTPEPKPAEKGKQGERPQQQQAPGTHNPYSIPGGFPTPGWGMGHTVVIINHPTN